MADPNDYVDLMGPDGNTVQAARSQLSPDFIQQYAAQQATQPGYEPSLAPPEPSVLGAAARQALVGMVPGGGVINAIDSMKATNPEVAQEAANEPGALQRVGNYIKGYTPEYGLDGPNGRNSLDLGGMAANALAPNMAAQARLGNAETDNANGKMRADADAMAKREAALVPQTQQVPPGAPGLPSVAPVAFKPFGGNDKAVSDAYRMQQEAARKQAEIGAQRAAEDYGYQKEALGQQAQLDADRAHMVGEYQRHRQEGLDRLQRMNDDFANTQIDPQRYWSNKSGFEKAMAAIAMGLGGFAGSAEPAKIIQQAVSDDIDAQKANLQTKGRAIENQHGVLALMRQNFGDDVEANAAARAAITTQLQSRIQMLASKYDSPELKAKADGLVGQLEAQKQNALAEFAQRRNENSYKAAMLSLEQQKVQLEQIKAGAALAKNGGGKQLNAAQVKDMTERRALISELKGLLADYHKAAGYAGSSIASRIGSTQAAGFYDRVQPLAMGLAKMLHGRAPTPENQARIDALMPQRLDTEATGKRKLKTLIKMAEDNDRVATQALSSSGYAAPAGAERVKFSEGADESEE